MPAAPLSDQDHAASPSCRRRLGALALLLPLAFAASGFKWFNRTAPEPDRGDTQTIVQIQIYLDAQHLGPGKIDGQLGEFTRKAVANYNLRHGIEAGNWYRLLKESGRSVRQIYRVYTVRPEDAKFVGELAFAPPEQAESDYMYYRSIAEFVAERFHTDEKFLARVNPGRDLKRLAAGDTVVVPNVEPFRIEAIELNREFPASPHLSRRYVIVDTGERLAVITQNRRLIASFPITPGKEQYIPYGTWKIKVMVTTPVFRYDKQMLEEGIRGDEFYKLPPGPNSPVGIFWAGLDKSGIGLHGTSSPETIGRSQSAGCIRLANWDAIRLSYLVRPGATVEVR